MPASAEPEMTMGSYITVHPEEQPLSRSASRKAHPLGGGLDSTASVATPGDGGAVGADPAVVVECAHCGLPCGRRPVSGEIEGMASLFCCYGCVLAMQVTRARGDAGAATALLVRVGLAIFFTINLMMVSMPTYVPYVYGDELAPTDGPLFLALRVLAMAFAAPVLLLLGGPILASAVRSLRAGSANTDTLIVLGSLAAYGLSVSNTLRGVGDVYFDTAAMLLILVTIGRYLEASAKASAASKIESTLSPAPVAATRVAPFPGAVAPADLTVGDLVRVTAGALFPTDGVVVTGLGGVDEAALTGESAAVLKAPGDAVAGGTASIDGIFTVQVTATAADSATARIAAMLVAARRERAPIERRADRLAAVLMPLVVLVAGGAGVFWYLHAGIDQAVLTSLAVLIVACPCGLGIATPVAVWTGLATAARHGVIVRTAPIFERLVTIRRVVFDKTGTLTGRTPRLQRAQARALGGEDRMLAYAAAIESDLTHPLARAIVAAAADRGLALPSATGVRVVPGCGVRGWIDGSEVIVGSSTYAATELGRMAPRPDMPAGSTQVDVWERGTLLGTLEFGESLRPEAMAAVQQVRQLQLRVGVLSGDRSGSAVVPSLFHRDEAELGLLPGEKVGRLRAGGAGTTVMVGDGINDAPALAAAHVGIAVGSATDLARITADVTIVHDDLRRVPWLLGYSRRVRRVIHQNLFWAFAYNFGAVAAAAAGLLNPLLASLAMIGSSLAVIANARRLRHVGGLVEERRGHGPGNLPPNACSACGCDVTESAAEL